ncbi:MAG: hypothetical protein ABFD89_00800 [Bryobacteraceae bacterium]
MSDTLGNITVPEITASGTFPITPDFPYGYAIEPGVAVHRFGAGNTKIEQRFYLGTGTKRFVVKRSFLTDIDREALRDFWEAQYGPYGAFTYNAPTDSGIGTTAYTVRFENEPLSWEMVADWACSIGVTLVEIPTTSPTYTLNSTVTRFPSTALQTALLSQVQQVIPLIKIQPRETGYPAIYLSDRRCTVGTQLYLARLLEFDGISQGMGNESDDASFTFGNADRVMRDLVNGTNLDRASIEFSLFHVGTGIKVDLWKGNVEKWEFDEGPEFTVTATDPLAALTMTYPCRKISRTCWKEFDDSAACPYTASGSLDLVNFPDAVATSCDKGFATDNGCQAHGMDNYFGGIIANPASVRIKDNSTGTWGFGRSAVTATSIVADSIYGQVIPEIYTDQNMPVQCKIAAGREESDFYAAVGVIGEGPLGGLVSGHYEDRDGDGEAETWIGPDLDGQTNHGPGTLGLSLSLGADPNPDEFGFDTDNPEERAAGTAFMMIRRVDTPGIQPTAISGHTMNGVVSSGAKRWVWTAAGTRTEQVTTNPVWIAVNMMLRARGLQSATAAVAEGYFDLDSAIASAAICDETVTPIFTRKISTWVVDEGGYYDVNGDWVEETGHTEETTVTSETQFKFCGTIREPKALRDWIQEVLMNCLGYYTFSFGKLKIGVRINSSAAEAFTTGNVIYGSLKLSGLEPSYNHLTGYYADEQYEFTENSVEVRDESHAKLIGCGYPEYPKGTINFCGVSNKSQAGRIITVRLREELGGITAAEWRAARNISFRTTILALNADPGTVCSLTHADMPSGAGEFRISSWRLNKDYSIDIQGRTTTDSMYDLTAGPKPADVSVSPVSTERITRTATSSVYPEPWGPNKKFPVSGDAMVAATESTFSVNPDYSQKAADGSAIISLNIAGAKPVTVISSLTPPSIVPMATIASTGGTLTGEKVYYIGVCAKDSAGTLSCLSTIARANLPSSGSTYKATISTPVWSSSATGYSVFMGTDSRALTWQFDGTGKPTSIDIASFRARTWSAPDSTIDLLRIKVNEIFHAGVFWTKVTAVTTNTITVSGASWTTDEWAGRIVSVISKDNDSALPQANYLVSANTTNALTVSPDPSTGSGSDNLLRYSEDFAQWNSNTYGSVDDPVLTAGQTDPNSGTDAYKVETFGAGCGPYLMFESEVCNRTMSVWMKGETGGESIRIGDDQDGGSVGVFALTTSWVRYEWPITSGPGGYRSAIIYADSAAATWYVFGAQVNTGLTATTYVKTTGLPVESDPVIETGDVIVMRSKPTISGDTLTDALWANGLASATGLTVDQEIGRYYLIIAGTGRGEWSRIIDNTATSITVEGFETTLDSTSIGIIVSGSWQVVAESPVILNSDPTAGITLAPEITNYSEKQILIAAVTVNESGIESPLELSPIRELYIEGADGEFRSDLNIMFKINGDAEVGTSLGGSVPIACDSGVSVEFVEATAVVDTTAPVGSDIIIDLNLIGTSVFGTTKLVIPAGATLLTVYNQTTFSDPAPVGVKDDLVTMDVDQIGSTTPGTDITVTLRMRKVYS